MLEFDKIKEYFDPRLARLNPKGVLVEYLQYEFLDSLFKIPGSERLCFIGGTAIRLIHQSHRFSEDLDFDDFGLDFQGFSRMLAKTCEEIKLKGFPIEARVLKKGDNFHGYIKFPGLVYQLGLSGHREEKILLSLDAEVKKKLYVPETVALNKFGVFRKINVAPPPVLMAQKLLAVLSRPRAKGRDFYDVSFLAGKTRPDYAYLKKLTGLSREEFAGRVRERCARLDFRALARDVSPFLFEADQTDRVRHFPENLSAVLAS